MTAWREQRNEQATARLERALPAIFPRGVIAHARGRPFVPPLPRLAIESYWRSHPIRADRLARALATVSGQPVGWTWQIGGFAEGRQPRSFRAPPTPFREAAFALGPGYCCICGQPVFRFGWHRDLWGDGKRNTRAEWHACCVAAWKLWTAPITAGTVLRRVQRRRCGATGLRLLKAAEIDHRTPLFAVWRNHRGTSWPALLAFWGMPNLQAINRTAHVTKCSTEAADRASHRQARALPSGSAVERGNRV